MHGLYGQVITGQVISTNYGEDIVARLEFVKKRSEIITPLGGD